jgi:hypothetical protein
VAVCKRYLKVAGLMLIDLSMRLQESKLKHRVAATSWIDLNSEIDALHYQSLWYKTSVRPKAYIAHSIVYVAVATALLV